MRALDRVCVIVTCRLLFPAAVLDLFLPLQPLDPLFFGRRRYVPLFLALFFRSCLYSLSRAAVPS